MSIFVILEEASHEVGNRAQSRHQPVRREYAGVVSRILRALARVVVGVMRSVRSASAHGAVECSGNVGGSVQRGSDIFYFRQAIKKFDLNLTFRRMMRKHISDFMHFTHNFFCNLGSWHNTLTRG